MKKTTANENIEAVMQACKKASEIYRSQEWNDALPGRCAALAASNSRLQHSLNINDKHLATPFTL